MPPAWRATPPLIEFRRPDSVQSRPDLPRSPGARFHVNLLVAILLVEQSQLPGGFVHVEFVLWHADNFGSFRTCRKAGLALHWASQWDSQ